MHESVQSMKHHQHKTTQPPIGQICVRVITLYKEVNILYSAGQNTLIFLMMPIV